MGQFNSSILHIPEDVAAGKPQEILETAVTQLKNALNVRSVHVRVGMDAAKGEAPREKS